MPICLFVVTIFMIFSSKQSLLGQPLIKANFSYTTHSNDNYPMQVSFQNASAGADSYLWEFSNGTKSTSVSPAMNFNFSGTLGVTLIARKGSAVDSITKTIQVPYRKMSVVFIYLVTTEGGFDHHVFDAIKNAAPQLQEWYKNQSGGKTFRLNNPVVDTVHSAYSSFEYGYDPNQVSTARKEVWGKIGGRAKSGEQIIITFLWASPTKYEGITNNDLHRSPFGLLLSSAIKSLIADSTSVYGNWGMTVAAHELGHTFALEHDNDMKDLMFGPETGPPYIHTGPRLHFPFCYLLNREKEKLKASPFLF